MADKKEYIVKKSNYALYERHKTLDNNKMIYVRDYMTLNDGGKAVGDGQYGASHFKILPVTKSPETRDIGRGNWVKKEGCDEDGCDTWKYDDVKDARTNIDDEIIINVDTSDITDFIYYGSAYETFKNTINGIINNYPAELYVSEHTYEELYSQQNGKDIDLSDFGIERAVLIENPFLIDIVDNVITEETINKEGLNKYRFFNISSDKYTILSDDGETIRNVKWSVEAIQETGKRCYGYGDVLRKITLNDGSDGKKPFIIYECFVYGGNASPLDGSTILLCDGSFSGMHIRPCEEAVNDFFNSLTHFGKMLMNRNGKELYSMIVNTPEWTDEYGILLKKKKYTWPTVNGWNLDVVSSTYSKYIESLLNLATILDEYYTNNLWKNMVHDSIKNMDLTYVNKEGDIETEDFSLGLSKLEKVMYTYGQFFDMIKLYIDNIRNVNCVTYDGNNNNPYYFLTDTLDLGGWETKNVVNTLDDVETDVLYVGNKYNFRKKDANVQFLKNLKLNSDGILSRKGTRHGLEMILGLFGLRSYDFAKTLYDISCEDDKIKGEDGETIKNFDSLPDSEKNKLFDYRINEYVCVAKPNGKNYKYDIDETSREEGFNSFKIDFKSDGDINVNVAPSVTIDRGLDGLPIAQVMETDADGNTKYYYIPWYDPTMKYDGGLYYQMYGGWGKTDEKFVDNKDYAVSKIKSSDDYSLYDESVKSIKVVNNVGRLVGMLDDVLQDGIIVKVLESGNVITRINETFGEDTITDSDGSDYSNYFILGNVGYKDEYSERGWQCIKKSDIDKGIGNGLKFINMASIVESNVGNAPHIGNYKYDDGKTYFEYFKQLFKHAIDNDRFNINAYHCDNGTLLDEIKNCGFNFTVGNGGDIYVKDNMKCWYFENEEGLSTPISVNGDDYSNTVGKDRKNTLFESDVTPYNYQNGSFDKDGEHYIESSYSIMNNKKMLLEFNIGSGKDDIKYKYINDVILFYAKQLIPSSTILEIRKKVS